LLQSLQPLNFRCALLFREQQALRRQLYALPSELLCGGAFLLRRDELFRARQYVFVET
jgi:hypothetical protein